MMRNQEVQKTMNVALLVIDVQLGGFDGVKSPAMHNGGDLVEAVNNSISAIRQRDIPVIFIQHSGASGSAFEKDTVGWPIHPALDRRLEDTVVHKRLSNGFDGTNLEQVLQAQGIDTVVTCGLQSEFCVANTSIGALQSGRQVIVVADAHGTEDTSAADALTVVKNQNERLARKGAILLHISELAATKLM
jgi:nicotinamidase-related amidase